MGVLGARSETRAIKNGLFFADDLCVKERRHACAKKTFQTKELPVGRAEKKKPVGFCAKD